MVIFKEEATSALAGFHLGRPSRPNWNLEILVFQVGGKPKKGLEKNPRSNVRANNQLNLQVTSGRNQTGATLMGGGRHSRYCTILDCMH